MLENPDEGYIYEALISDLWHQTSLGDRGIVGNEPCEF